MTGTNRTIARRLHLALWCALLFSALIPAAGAAAAKPAPLIKSAWSSVFPNGVHGISVAVRADGIPWFGLWTAEQPLSVATVKSGKLEIEPLRKEGTYETSEALAFDSQGRLWFARDGEASSAIARRNQDGTVTEFDLPKGAPVTALTFGPEGDIWFVRSGYGEKAQVGRMTPGGAVTAFPLETGSRPTSITAGPDGALWFNEERADRIGRITTSGEVRLFPLAPKVEPRQIVAGPDGTLWFGENARARRYGRFSDRIGRITTTGQVSELPIPFGNGTSRLAADPSGVIWFATDEGEISSIAPSGNVGPRGCVRGCGDPIESLAFAPDGALWFAAGHAPCGECGGVSSMMYENTGTMVSEIPPGALTPADPDGPPAVDPYAMGQPKPPPPIARTGKALEVEGDYAEITGYVNPRTYPTTWLFRWGKTKSYGHRTFLPERPFTAEERGGVVGEELLDLCPGTTYHYEIVAFGPGGHTPGGDRTFKTPPEKHPPKHCLRH